jgi:hypothetical protein
MVRVFKIVLIFLVLAAIGLGMGVLTQDRTDRGFLSEERVLPKKRERKQEVERGAEKEGSGFAGTSIRGFQIPGSEEWDLLPAGMKEDTPSASP